MPSNPLAVIYPRDQEVWRPVPGYLGIYEASSLGRVKSLSRPIEHNMRDGRTLVRVRKERILKPSFWTGYPAVMTIGGLQYVHTLLLETFVGPRPNGQIGLHFDDDPLNCWIGNLRWGTYTENAKDARRNGIKIGAPIGNKNRLGGNKFLSDQKKEK